MNIHSALSSAHKAHRDIMARTGISMARTGMAHTAAQRGHAARGAGVSGLGQKAQDSAPALGVALAQAPGAASPKRKRSPAKRAMSVA